MKLGFFNLFNWSSKMNKTDWEVALSVVCPKIKRPRRTSLHTLATVLGRTDILALAEELQKSDKVVGYRCPDVKCLIFYLKSMIKCPGMIDTRDDKVWEKVKPFCEEYPLDKVRGFKRFVPPTWSGGSYGLGKQIPGQSNMSYPYEEADYDYAKKIIEELKMNGFRPGIEFINEDGKEVCKVIKPCGCFEC